MSDEPSRLGSRLLDLCIAALLGAMALYGAVAILRSIWLYLCIALAVGAAIALVAGILMDRYWRW